MAEVESVPPPTFLPVPDLKQFSLPWGDDVYNDANRWYPTDPSMARWGCAVTSAAMILQFYGHPTDPGGLNAWLKSQPDGYIRNGVTNWLAISRYTRAQNAANGAYPILQYRKIQNADMTTLASELDAGHPIILGEPSHFVVAKGEQDSTFAINDPGYTDRPTLESYGNTFTSFGRYTITSTDLSAIMLVVDGDTNISLFDSSGSPIDAISYLQEPLEDDIDGTTTSGETLRVLIFQEPPQSEYTVEIEGGDGPFQLDAYLYDKQGNLIDNLPSTLNGLALEGMPETLHINYDQDSNTPSLEENEPTLESSLQDLQILWLLGWIDDEDVYVGLRDKLIAAQQQADSGKTKSARNILNAFLNQLEAQKENHINLNGYNLLLEEVNFLLDGLA